MPALDYHYIGTVEDAPTLWGALSVAWEDPANFDSLQARGWAMAYSSSHKCHKITQALLSKALFVCHQLQVDPHKTLVQVWEVLEVAPNGKSVAVPRFRLMPPEGGIGNVIAYAVPKDVEGLAEYCAGGGEMQKYASWSDLKEALKLARKQGVQVHQITIPKKPFIPPRAPAQTQQLTPEERHVMVMELADFWLDNTVMKDVLLYGHKGFQNMTDAELIAEHKEVITIHASDEELLAALTNNDHTPEGVI